MKKITIVACAAALITGCSGEVTGPEGSSGREPATTAGAPAARIDIADCRDGLIPALWSEGEYNVMSLDATRAGCMFVAETTHGAEELTSKIGRELAQRGYQLTGTVAAKGGERHAYESHANLAVSALVRARKVVEGERGYASQVDLHWYDPSRLGE